MGAEVLIVEDEVLVARDIAQSLVELGFRVAGSVRSGEEALALAARAPPSLILLDIKLAGALTGIDVAERVRAELQVPFVFLTSHSDDATLDRAKLTRPHGYLLKPFNTRDLKSTIEIALAQHDLESRLVASERWTAMLLRAIGDGVIATDAEGRVSFLNPAAEQITGWTQAEALGRPADEVCPVSLDGAPLLHPLTRTLRMGERTALESGVELLTRRGVRVIADTAAPIVGDRGVVGAVMVFQDVTEQRALAQRVAQSERLAALGQMAEGLMHELNNPLAYVLANARFALTRLEDDARRRGTEAVSEALEAVRDAHEGADRIAGLVHELRQVVRSESAPREHVRMDDAVAMAVHMLRALDEDHGRVRLELSPGPRVRANAGQLAQVVLALVRNALAATTRAGKPQAKVLVRTGTTAAGHARLEVEDVGVGMTPDVVARVFDPFFTTQPAGQGLGLGLSICHRIVSDHGGTIRVRTEPGVGSCFTVEVPPCAVVTERLAEPRAPEAPRASLRVLVVDDDAPVGRAIRRTLAAHEVELETDPVRALERFERGERYDVVVCDVRMPSLTGPEFHVRLRAIDGAQAARLVFVTGGPVSPAVRRHVDAAGVSLVHKPFTSEQLLSAVASAHDVRH
jgi:two-component system cell cycle sensor histidine kinase/response regulator CckA